MKQAEWEAIQAWVDQKEEYAVSSLMSLLVIPTVAYPDRANPSLTECARALVDRLRALGAKDARIAGSELHPLVLGSLGDDAGKPTLLVYGHFDVVDPGPQIDWQSDPFSPTIRNGRVYGRGSGDNKGQFIAHLLAVEAFQESGVGLPVNLKFVFDGAEEIGSPSLAELRSQDEQSMLADLVYAADGSAHESGQPKVLLGSRGVVFVEVMVRTLRRRAHSQYAGVLPNAVWRALEIMASLRDPRGRVLVRGFYEDVLPTTSYEMELLTRLPPVRSELTREFEPVPPLPDEPAQEFNARLLMEPVINIAGIQAGDLSIHQTVVPDSCMVQLDIGIVPGQSVARTMQLLRDHLSAFSIEPEDVHMVFGVEPAQTPPDHPLVVPIANAVGRAWGVPPVVVNRFAAFSPHHANWQALGIPVISASYAQPDQSNHAPNENLSLENFRKSILASAAVFDTVGTALGVG